MGVNEPQRIGIPRPQVVVCPTCNGAGRQQIRRQFFNTRYVLCEPCEGTGEIVVSMEEYYRDGYEEGRPYEGNKERVIDPSSHDRDQGAFRG